MPVLLLRLTGCFSRGGLAAGSSGELGAGGSSPSDGDEDLGAADAVGADDQAPSPDLGGPPRPAPDLMVPADLVVPPDLRPLCGNGIIEPTGGEVCDDGNRVGGDGCSADCGNVECTHADRYEDPVTHHCSWRETGVVRRETAVARRAARGGYLFRWGSAAERDAVCPATLGGPRGPRVDRPAQGGRGLDLGRWDRGGGPFPPRRAERRRRLRRVGTAQQPQRRPLRREPG